MHERHPAGDAVTIGVSPGDCQRGPRHIDRDDARALHLAREAHRQAPRAGTDIHDDGEAPPRGREVGRARARFLDDQLGLRARREDVAGHLEVETPELAHADDERHRLAPGPAINPGAIRFAEPRGRVLPAVGQVSRPIPAEEPARQDLGVNGGVGGADSRGAQANAARRNVSREGHSTAPPVQAPGFAAPYCATAVASLSFSAW